MKNKTAVYNMREYLAFLGASLLEDKKSVFVGTGLPIIATMLAQKTTRNIAKVLNETRHYKKTLKAEAQAKVNAEIEKEKEKKSYLKLLRKMPAKTNIATIKSAKSTCFIFDCLT